MSDTDPRRIVERGYDLIGERYAEWTSRGCSEARENYTDLLISSVPKGSPVLDLGCGAGEPTTRRLAEHFAVTGVDISANQISLARRSIPNATFIQDDIAEISFPAESFDAVAAFYSLTHLPRELHGGLLDRVTRWITPGGLLVTTMGASEAEGVEEDWLGTRMHFSHYGTEESRRLVQSAGMEIEHAEERTELEDGARVTFLWVVARKP